MGAAYAAVTAVKKARPVDEPSKGRGPPPGDGIVGVITKKT